MKSEDMKMKKFEMLVKDIDDYLGSTAISGEKEITKIDENSEEKTEIVPISPLEFIFDDEEKNEYINIIYKNTFKNRTNNLWSGLCERSYDLELNEIDNKDIIKFIEKIRKCNECEGSKKCDGSKKRTCRVPNHLMFWLIFIVCVDNDNYNENLNVVSDMAYLLGFDEKKLSDWITAVKGAVSGKKLNEMRYQTEDAKEFFVR